MAKALSARSGRKLTKKELREDKLVNFAAKAEHFYNENKNRVLGAVIVIVVLIVGGILIQKMSTGSRLTESYDLTVAKMAFGQQQYDQARGGLESVLANYSGDVAAEAKYYLARIDFEQGNYALAETGFRDYLNSFSGSDYIDCAVEAGLAASLEAQQKYAEAASGYEAIADHFPKLPYATEALVEAGRVYMQIKQDDNAVRVLQKLVKDYPESASAAKAKQDLNRLQ
jgi:TolA-binding protein